MKALRPLLVLALFILAGSSFAQSYPVRPIRLIVPYPPGGGTDIAARWIAQKLGERLGQPVVVENKSGAGGNIGTDAIAKARPDGYTIGMATPGPMTVSPSLDSQLPYDPRKDLEPIILANESPIVLVTSPKLPVKTLNDVVALAKAKPGRVTAALVSIGSVPHLLTELFASSNGIALLDVPYKGGSPAVTDVLSGQVDMLFSVLPLVLPFINGNELNAIAVASERRTNLLPNVPTTKEAGSPKVIGSAWNGVVAPAGIPPEIARKLNSEINALLHTAETKERFAGLGMESVGGSASEFRAFLAAETEKWSKVVKDANIRPN